MRSPHPHNASYRAWHATLLIRFMGGVVFLAEGLQKFIYPEMRGPGRFEGMGFPSPEFWGYFVGSFETICGALVLVGLLTRLAALPLLIIIRSHYHDKNSYPARARLRPL